MGRPAGTQHTWKPSPRSARIRRSASLLSPGNRPALSDESRSASYITGCDTNLQSISCATLHSLAAVAIIFREITLISISSIRQRVLMHEDQARRMLLCREQLIISDEPGLDEGVQNQVCTRTRNSEEQHAKVDLVAHLSGRQAG